MKNIMRKNMTKEKLNMENSKEAPSESQKISRRKILATMGLTSAAVATGAMIPGFNGQASADPNRDADQSLYRYAGYLPERSVSDKLREFVSVKDFGAKGDGSTNDTAAIQAAIDYAVQTGRREIFFPDGTYKLGLHQGDDASSAKIKEEIDMLKKEGEIHNENTVLDLQIHLTALDHFEQQRNPEKVLQYTDGFVQLLNHHKEHKMLTDKAYTTLQSQAASLQHKWESFDKDNIDGALHIAPSIILVGDRVNFTAGSYKTVSLADLHDQTGSLYRENEVIKEQLAQIEQQETDIEAYVKRKEVDIWDFAHLVTDKPDPDDPNTWDWTIAIQQAIDFVTESYKYNKLKFPPGKYKISDTVGVSAATDIDIGLHISGSGRTASTGRATTIEQSNPTKDCLSFRSSRSNMRGLIIEDIQIYGGVNGLYLENNVYNYFRNVSFSRQTEQCIRSRVSSLNYFDGCYGVHVSGNFCIFNGAGTNFFVNCKIGEDIGGVHVSTGILRFSNCSFHDIRNKNEATGLYGLGNNVFGVDDGGQLFVDNSTISTNRNVCEVLITTNNQRNSAFSNCYITLQNQTFLVSRYQTLHYKGSPFNMINNHIEWDGNAALFSNGVGISSSPLKNSILDGNTFTIPLSVTIQTEDWFLNPSLNNKMGINTIKEV